MDMMIERGFVRVREGLIHYRARSPEADTVARPLYLMHPSPASARGLEPLMAAIHGHGLKQRLIAPDTLGNGDSAPPEGETPDIAYFADSVRRVLDGLKIDKADIYGAHTGARTAAEFAVIAPDRVGKIVFDGIVEYDDALKRQILDNYAPEVKPDEFGRHLIWAFNFVRDQAFHFPYFMRDPGHRLSGRMRATGQLHEHVVDVLKGLTTYHKPYLAAFRYEPTKRLPLVQAPSIFLAADTEPPHLRAAAAGMAALVPGARVVETTNGVSGKAAAIAAFLAN
ncbi:MAG: alpha/beta hydrolase [Rhodobacteraceae bacterium]|nr:alpha/beta hydrolase [Paracoccaceae bacterium]